jgi:hypothetical protein
MEISGANTHGIKLLEETLQSLVTAHPEGAGLCLDAGYTGVKGLVENEKKSANYLGLLHFACAIILWRQIIPVHPGLFPDKPLVQKGHMFFHNRVFFISIKKFKENSINIFENNIGHRIPVNQFKFAICRLTSRL